MTRLSVRRSMLVPAMLGAAASLGACAAALPGHIPEGGHNKAFARVKPFEPGTVEASGAYVPSQMERDLDCRKLRGSMFIMIARIRDGSAIPAASVTSSVAQSAVAVVRGRRIIEDANVIEQRERARLDAYNKLLVAKQCPPVDLAAELAKPAVAAAPVASTPAKAR